MVLIILAIIWAAVLVPPWLRNRDTRRGSRTDSMHGFRSQLSTMGRQNGGRGGRGGRGADVFPIRPAARPAPSQLSGPVPGHSLVARAEARNGSEERSVRRAPQDWGEQMPRHIVMSRAEARRRRRNILFVLMGLAGVTFLAAVAVQGAFLVLHLLADLVLIGYITLLVQHQRRAEERRAKVRPIRPAGQPVSEPVPAYRPRLRSAN